MPFLACLVIAASLGAMIFFSGVIAPLVFRVLPADRAGQFLRAMFPKYFLINGLLAAVAAMLAAHSLATPLLLLAASAMLAIVVWAIPVINTARDAMLTGDLGAKRTFDAWHRATVMINSVEMVLLVGAVAILWQ